MPLLEGVVPGTGRGYCTPGYRHSPNVGSFNDLASWIINGRNSGFQCTRVGS
jgi:hypothetical protein